MSSEENLIQVRKDKHQEINGTTYPLAANPPVLPFIYHTTVGSLHQALSYLNDNGHLVTSIVPTELGDTYKYITRGRITAMRKSGAITFIRITDFSGAIQVIVSKAAYTNYESLKLFDLGDIVEVGGRPCQSKTGEKSLLAFSIRLLTKAHRPPPEKFAGIADQELKYRKRHLDLMSSEEARARFTVRTYAIRAIRDFMEGRSFLEVETPTLGAIASGANAKPFITHHNALDMDMRLRIAPELYLKRLLVGGLDRVFEIGRNYRNEGIDTRHNPEFTMMESYQAYGNFEELLSFTKLLIQHVTQYLNAKLPSSALGFYQTWTKEATYDLWGSVEVSMERAVLSALQKMDMKADDEFAKIEFIHLSDEAPAEAVRRRSSGLNWVAFHHLLDQCQTRGERLALCFEFFAEPFLVEDYRNNDGTKSVPVFITEYPKDISPLARANDDDPSVCDRFELFVDGRELANAFQELNDPDEQALRFQEQLDANDKDPMDYDADYVEALEHGMPPAIGFGIGIDRLVMLLTNTTSIKEVILFPTLRPEK